MSKDSTSLVYSAWPPVVHTGRRRGTLLWPFAFLVWFVHHFLNLRGKICKCSKEKLSLVFSLGEPSLIAHSWTSEKRSGFPGFRVREALVGGIGRKSESLVECKTGRKTTVAFPGFVVTPEASEGLVVHFPSLRNRRRSPRSRTWLGAFPLPNCVKGASSNLACLSFSQFLYLSRDSLIVVSLWSQNTKRNIKKD